MKYMWLLVVLLYGAVQSAAFGVIGAALVLLPYSFAGHWLEQSLIVVLEMILVLNFALMSEEPKE